MIRQGDLMALKSAARWVPFSGRWEIGDKSIEYLQDFEGDRFAQTTGLAACDLRMDEGIAEVTATLDKTDEDACARIVFRKRGNASYYAAGLGGWGRAYTIAIFELGEWRPLKMEASHKMLIPQKQYRLQVAIDTQKITLRVDDVIGAECSVSPMLEGDGLGLMAWRSHVTFSSFRATPPRPIAFVMMPFSDAMTPLYLDVIRRTVIKAGYECRRADNVVRPGDIIDDVHLDIARAAVVIAEVSSPNPNVYYELGYATAKGKPTILIAKRGTQLPFDISSRRCVFYGDDEMGHDELDSGLHSSLTDIGSRAV